MVGKSSSEDFPDSSSTADGPKVTRHVAERGKALPSLINRATANDIILKKKKSYHTLSSLKQIIKQVQQS